MFNICKHFARRVEEDLYLWPELSEKIGHWFYLLEGFWPIRKHLTKEVSQPQWDWELAYEEDAQRLNSISLTVFVPNSYVGTTVCISPWG